MIQFLLSILGKEGIIRKADKRRLRSVTGIVFKAILRYAAMGRFTVGQCNKDCLWNARAVCCETITHGSEGGGGS